MGQVDEGLKKRRAKSESSTAKTQRWSDVEFVNYELDESQRKACKEHEVNTDWVFDKLFELCSDGYSLSVRFDSPTSAYAAFMQLRGAKGVNEGLILTGRGSSPFKAVKQLLYKHYVCLDGDWRAFAEHRSDIVFDD